MIVRNAGAEQQFIDTGTYVAERIAMAPDHTFWTLGNPRRGPFTPEDRQFRKVRRYSADGTLVGEFLPASLFPLVKKGQAISGGPIGDPFIAVAQDRVGIYYPANQSWMELDIEGRIRGRWTLPLPVWRLAYTQAGRLFSLSPGLFRLREFDRSSASWKNLPPDLPPQFLLGVDGSKLMLGKAGPENFEVLELEPAP